MSRDPDLTRVFRGSPSEVLTVSALTRSVRDLLEHRYPLLRVSGEISNFAAARSGHIYFALKDEYAQVRCVMFRQRNQSLDWEPREGNKVEVQALVTLYEPRGDFQLNVESMRLAGEGVLYEAFLRLRARLEKEGLFDELTKRPVPQYPRRVGIVTSPDAAALRDVLSTLARRNSAIDVILYPAPVQGTGAGEALAAAVARAGERGECDVLILCRGGGSLEDLWAFNDERLARALRSCAIPVVTGIGHETDFTIADLAADRRAPTPTGAAELVSPLRRALLERVSELLQRSQRQMAREFDTRAQWIDLLQRRLVHPGRRLAERSESLVRLQDRLAGAMAMRLKELRWRIDGLAHRNIARLPHLCSQAKLVGTLARRVASSQSTFVDRLGSRIAALGSNLSHLDPLNVLDRGYSIVARADGAIVRDGASLAVGDPLSLRFARGSATARVETKE